MTGAKVPFANHYLRVAAETSAAALCAGRGRTMVDELASWSVEAGRYCGSPVQAGSGACAAEPAFAVLSGVRVLPEIERKGGVAVAV